jgi:hypothetical protein
MSATPILVPPRRFRRLMQRVSARDRAYFERRPDVTDYVRPYVPGESWPLVFPATHVRVTQIAPGVRTKAFLIVTSREGGPI